MTSLPVAKKSLGQHWLTDTATLEAMCDAADVGDQDVVLEIGPGAGTLTKHLVERARQVVAVEFDDQLAAKLPKAVPASNLQVIHQDILKFDLTHLPSGYKVAANIPYYLTSNLLRTLSESANPPQVIALLVQKEVAERIAAKPGAMSLLSVSVQFYYQPQLGMTVLAELFTPPPKVDSQIIKLTRHPEPLFPNIDTKKFFQIVRAGYSARRKTLLNSLSAALRLSKREVTDLLHQAEIDPTRRAQSLTLADWKRIYDCIYEI